MNEQEMELQETVALVMRPNAFIPVNVEWTRRLSDAVRHFARQPATVGFNRCVESDDLDIMERLKNPLTPFGRIVRSLRVLCGTSLMEMANELGMSPSTLSAYECR